MWIWGFSNGGGPPSSFEVGMPANSPSVWSVESNRLVQLPSS